jgi:hypothetical protein
MLLPRGGLDVRVGRRRELKYGAAGLVQARPQSSSEWARVEALLPMVAAGLVGPMTGG